MKRNINNICPRCGVAKRLPQGWCRLCYNAWHKVYRQAYRRTETYKKSKRNYKKRRPDLAAKYNLRHRLKTIYGISVDEKHAMLAKQGFKCAACENGFDSTIRANVDHCHTSGIVRGILCSNCNWALGLMKENPESIRKLAAYIENFKKDR